MNTIDGNKWKEILASGVHSLSANKNRINALNVFPVPDGDTGSNMTGTATYAKGEVSSVVSGSIGDVSKAFARGMLLGARGNSGVILSQIFKGFAVAFEGKEEATTFQLVKAFSSAQEYAYKSVMQPVEGTMLTVIRETAEQLNKKITASDSIIDVFQLAVEEARKSTDGTPELLPVLKEVGVTDSGGEGLVSFLDGMLRALQGKPIEAVTEFKAADMNAWVSDDEDFNGEFGYCTEFIVELKKPNSFNKEKFEKDLTKLGNSIVIVQDEEILKTHLHALKPGDAFNLAQKYGEFIVIKSENMTLQANKSQKVKLSETGEFPKEELSTGNVAVVSCNVGQGIIDDMKEMGTDFIIEGGQTNNPSASDFIEAINQLDTDKIILLPNNSNIILVAQQVAQTVDKEIIVVPTKTQMQGLSAIMNFDSEGTIGENNERMLEAIQSVSTVQVTVATRTTKIDGVSVRDGEFLAIANRKIIKSVPSKTKAAIEGINSLMSDETEIVTIYYGVDATKTDAQEVATAIENNYDVEVEIKEGKQDVYHFLVAIE